jgi:hypothetical protein
MTDTEKLSLLLKVLKPYAEREHCYDSNPCYDPDCLDYSRDQVFDAGANYGEILFARTLLEQIGETFEYPCMKENV